MGELKRYSSDDLNWFVKTILILMIVAGCGYAFANFSKSSLSLGVAYACFELLVTTITIVANILLVSVNIRGFYMHVIMHTLTFVITICIDLESGIGCLFSAVGAIGFIFLLLQIRNNGVSAWKMMLANKKIQKGDIAPESDISSTSTSGDIKCDNELSPESSSQFPTEIPPTSIVAKITADSTGSIVPPPINHVADSPFSTRGDDVIVKEPEPKNSKEPIGSKEESRAKQLFRVRLNLFLYIAMGLFISIQILSIYMDGSYISLGRYYWDPIVETWRIVLASINIALAFIVLLWKRGWAFLCLTAISVASIFLVDSMALKFEWDIRDMMFNSMLFLGAYIPLIITLFFKNQGLSGWKILFGKTLVNTSKVETSLRGNKTETAQVNVKGEIDRYTRLCKAISPANFVEPYSPSKVKLANELLEALLKNKDNEVVIALIEEKAKNELGVKLSD